MRLCEESCGPKNRESLRNLKKKVLQYVRDENLSFK